jgi:pilus assembly protein Flp/PilA
MISQFILDEDGQSLVEYALLISLMALVVSVAVTLFSKAVQGNFNRIESRIPEINTTA